MTPQPTASAPVPGDTGDGAERPGAINAVPVRHPGRWLAVFVIVVLAAKGIQILVKNPAFDWSFIGQAMIQSPVIHGLIAGTIVATLGAMAIGVGLGVVLAVMRLSENKVLSYAAWFYIWFFRGVPRYVLLALMGALGTLFPPQTGGLGIGIPFGPEVMRAFGFHGHLQFFSLDANHLFGGILGGIVGLGLSEAAYMAEIARAGILSVDTGQAEAASALGMSRGQAMRRVVLPQAMRVIVPPTGNETIGMFKDTTLMTALPVTVELFYQLNNIGINTFKSFNTDVAAIIWYLIIGSFLMYIQMHLERHFGRGFGAKRPQRTGYQTLKAKMMGLGAAGGAR
jgi:polar amino acid transport system permease protein